MVVRETAQAIIDSDTIASKMISERVGNIFYRELQRTYRSISMTPTIGSIVEKLDGTPYAKIRVCTVRRFRNYVIFYRIEPDVILIERILDGRRNYLELITAD